MNNNPIFSLILQNSFPQLTDEINYYLNVTKFIYFPEIKAKLNVHRSVYLRKHKIDEKKLTNPSFLPEILDLAFEIKENNFNFFEKHHFSGNYYHWEHGNNLNTLIELLQPLADLIIDSRVKKKNEETHQRNLSIIDSQNKLNLSEKTIQEERINMISEKIDKTPLEINNWLKNFDKYPEFMLKLLEKFNYVSHKKLKIICDKLYKKLLEDHPYNKINRIFVNMGNAAKSDHSIAYLFRLYTGVSSDCFFDKNDPKLSTLKTKQIIYIDDISGTGNQFLKDWISFEKKLGEEFMNSNEFIFLPLFITDNAINNIEKHISKSNFHLLYLKENLLQEKNNSISMKSGLFTTEKKYKEIKDYLLKLGQKLYPKGPLGFENCGLLLAFYYNTPNNTLPIFWSKEDNWIPLFERYESKKFSDNLKSEEEQKSNSFLLKLALNDEKLKPKDIESLQIYSDHLNTLLNHEFKIVKKRYFFNPWKVGLIIYNSYPNLIYSFHPIKLGNNELLIQEHLPNTYNDSLNSRKIIGGWKSVDIINFLKDPKNNAFEDIAKKFTSLLYHYNLDNIGSLYIAREFIFNYIDENYPWLKIEGMKDEYTIEEIKNGLKIMFKNIDTDIENIYTDIGSNKDVSLKILKELIDWLTSINITKIKRIYKISDDYKEWKKKESSTPNLVVGRAFIYSKEDLIQNIIKFYSNLVETFNHMCSKNLPNLMHNFQLFQGATTILINIKFKDEAVTEDGFFCSPYICKKEVSCLKNRDELNQRIIVFFDEDENYPEIEPTKRIVEFEDKKYEIISMSVGSEEYIFRNLPMLDFIYEFFKK